MGTWSEGPFDNDDAADFLDEVSDGGAGVLREAIEDALRSNEPDASDASIGVAAACLVAVGQNPALGGDLPEDMRDELIDIGGELADMKSQALQLLTQLLNGPSEWRELWEEEDAFDDVKAGLQPFLQALA